MKAQLARLFCTYATALLVSAPYATRGGELNLDFSGDQPFWINGPGYVDWIGGVDDGPCLKLTDGGFFQNTWAFIFDLDFEPTTAFNAKFKMLMGGATAPADGISFNFASEYSWGFVNGEEGDGNNLSVCFDTYDNGGGEAPSIDIKKAGKTIFSHKSDVIDLVRTGEFVPVEVNVDQEGALSLTVNNQVIVTGLKRAFTRNYGFFAFGGRAGGLNDKHIIDDLQITTTTIPAALPYVSEVSPEGRGARIDSNIHVRIEDGVAPLDLNSIELRLDGLVVPITTEYLGGATAVIYDPPTNLDFGKKYVVQVTFSDASATPTTRTETFEFTTLPVRGPNGNYYEVGYQPFEFYTWQEAKNIAATRTWGGVPGHLATITDRAEDEFIELVRSLVIPQTDHPGLQEAWAGGYQLPGSGPGENWFWINNEGPIAGANNSSTYANWQLNEPNDGRGIDSENWLTVGLWNQFGWNDSGNYNFTMLRGYVIEYEAIQAPLDFKPGDASNQFDAASAAPIQIAVLTTPAFDASSIAVGKLTAGRTGVEARPTQLTLVDVDADGDLDLQLTFDSQELDLRCGDTRILVFAENADGAPLRGSDPVQEANCPGYSLTVTALQDAAHNTDVFLTLNAILPGFTAPNLAQQISLKSFNLSGAKRWGQTLKDVALTVDSPNTSSATLQFADLAHLQKLTARVKVKNGKSDAINVRADGRVLLRPDLHVIGVQGPASAKVRQTINLTATISEENRDLGATCTAYLMSGNTVLDHAAGVSVSPGGLASIHFAPRFTTAGAKTLRVVVGNVNPGDFNNANNSSDEFVIDINDVPLTSATSTLEYSFNNFEYYLEEKTEFGIAVYHEKTANEGLFQSLSVPANVVFPLDRISASIYSDGVEKQFSEMLNVTGYEPWFDGGCFIMNWNNFFLGQGVVLIETFEDICNGTVQTFITYNTFAGHDGFLSANFTATWDVDFMYGGGSGTALTTFLESQTTLGTYLIIESASAQLGGAIDITQLETSEFSDQWNNPTENGYSKGFFEQKSIHGFTSGFTQP